MDDILDRVNENVFEDSDISILKLVISNFNVFEEINKIYNINELSAQNENIDFRVVIDFNTPIYL